MLDRPHTLYGELDAGPPGPIRHLIIIIIIYARARGLYYAIALDTDLHFEHSEWLEHLE